LVPFKPDPSKLVYCNECFEIIKNKKKDVQRGEQSIVESPIKLTDNCNDEVRKNNDAAIEQKRKEIKEKIDNSGLADTLRNLFKN